MSWMKSTLFKSLLCICLACYFVPTVQAALRMKVRYSFGFGDVIRANSWYPVRVDMTSKGPTYTGMLDLVTSEGLVSTRVHLPSGARKQVTLYARGRFIRLTVRDLEDDEVDLQSVGRPVLATRDNLVILHVTRAEKRGGLEFLHSILGSSSRGSVLTPVVVVPASRQTMPGNILGLGGLDLVVLGDESYEQFDPAQNQALLHWLIRGGTVVVIGGTNPDRFRNWPLADYFPVRLDGTVQRSDLSCLRDKSTLWGSQTLRAIIATNPQLIVETGPFVMTRARMCDGARVLLADKGLPLVARCSVGSGTVFFLATDPRHGPFTRMPNVVRHALWRSFFPWRGRRLQGNDPSVVASYRDEELLIGSVLSTKGIRSFLRLTTIEPPSVVLVVVFILLYVLLIAPGQYLLLRRLGRLELAWVVTPALAIVFFLIAFIAGYWRMGGQTICRSLSVVMGKASDRMLAQDSFVRLFSDVSREYLFVPRGRASVSLTTHSEAEERQQTVVGDRVAAGPLMLHMWAEHDCLVRGLRENDFAIEASLSKKAGRITGHIRNAGHHRFTGCALVTKNTYSIVDTKQFGQAKKVQVSSPFKQRTDLTGNLELEDKDLSDNLKLVHELLQNGSRFGIASRAKRDPAFCTRSV